MVRIIILLFMINTCVPLFGQERHYLYVKVDSQEKANYEFEYGNFEKNEEGKLSLGDVDPTMSNAVFISQLDSLIASLPEERRNIFIYIHGMWGHQDWYQKAVVSQFDNDILNAPDSQYGVFISLIWSSGINYHDNVAHAYEVGKFFNPLVEGIASLPHKKIKVLCHSMGNRVFQGIYDKIDKSSVKETWFDEVYFVAADLEADIFNSDQPLDSISTVVGKSIIYVHNNDRSLGMSHSLNKNNRLGLDADKSVCEQDECLYIVDVSSIDDSEGFATSLFNHRYFYTSPSVRNDLKLSILEKENKDRITLDHTRRLKLKPLDN